MAGLKRKSGTAPSAGAKSTTKKPKVEDSASKATQRKRFGSEPASDTSDNEHERNGQNGDAMDVDSSEASDAGDVRSKPKTKKEKKDNSSKKKESSNGNPPKDSTLAALNVTSSKEAHQKQKALAKERKAAKPNADLIDRAKKIWERLRLKSHVEKEERGHLLDELYGIVTGRVKELVFKHDSVRVIQCALKYSTVEQRKMIAKELKGDYKLLAESRYAKFLIAKLLENGEVEIRDMIISEFYGHVRQMINHPEAAWILDDTYRTVATSKQKARMLREWYGPEFSIKGLANDDTTTADLAQILKQSPEKRKPVMDFLGNLINQLLQKKLTGFTMLHDAMLQYFLACRPGTTEANDFLAHLKPDPTLKEGEEPDNVDLLKNLAFTKSGSRLVCLAVAYGSAKERKQYLRPYKDTMQLMAFDNYAHIVLLTAMAVTDDTRLTSKSIFGELLAAGEGLPEKVTNLANDYRARRVLLYPFVGDAKWLFTEGDAKERLKEVYAIRSTTSKKDPKIRNQELVKSIEPQLLEVVATNASDYGTTSNGCQFMTEVLLGVPEIEPAKREKALKAVVELATETPSTDLSERTPVSTARMHMFKALVQGGKFDPQTKKVIPVKPALGFADMFWAVIKGSLATWATGEGSFVIVGLAETEDEFEKRDELLKALKKERKALQSAADGGKPKSGDKKGKVEGNAGARILLQKL